MAVFEGSPKSLFSEQADDFGCLSHKVLRMLRIIRLRMLRVAMRSMQKHILRVLSQAWLGPVKNEVLRKCALQRISVAYPDLWIQQIKRSGLRVALPHLRDTGFKSSVCWELTRIGFSEFRASLWWSRYGIKFAALVLFLAFSLFE